MVQKQSHELPTLTTAKIGEFDVKNIKEETLLGVKIDTKLSFENKVSFLCKKAGQKLRALARVLHCSIVGN